MNTIVTKWVSLKQGVTDEVDGPVLLLLFLVCLRVHAYMQAQLKQLWGPKQNSSLWRYVNKQSHTCCSVSFCFWVSDIPPAVACA